MRVALSVLLILSAGCDPSAVTLAVDLRSDLVPGVEVASVEVDIEDKDSGALLERLRRDDIAPGTPLLDGIRIGEAQVTPGVRLIRGRAFDVTGTRVMEAFVIADVDGPSVRTLLLTRSCRGVECDPSGDEPTSCVGGRCMDARCSEETPEACESQCNADSACPDSPDPCASPRCMSGVCLLVSDDATCAPGDVCDPDEGCVTPGLPLDAGLPDGGPPDAGAPDAGAPDGGPPDAGVPPGRGTVTVSWRQLASGNEGHLTSCFWQLADDPPGGPCITPERHSACSAGTLLEGCEHYTCPVPIPSGATPPHPTAGALMITGVSTGPLVSTPDAMGVYPDDPRDNLLWTGGETITFDFAGAEVPAFNLSLVAPTQVTLTSPSFPAGTPAVSRSSGLTLTWTGGVAGDLVAVGLSIEQGATRHAIECEFDATTGSGLVPAMLLTRLPDGTGFMGVSSARLGTRVVGDYFVDASPFVLADRSDGQEASGSITLSP